MIFLILQVVFASLFGLVIKWVQNRNVENIVAIGCINYITAAVSILPFWLQRGETGATPDDVFGAMLSGGSMGGVYFIAYFFAIAAIRWIGASAASVVSVLSILLPIAFAAWYWKDLPTTQQLIGVGLALLALILIGASRQKGDEKVDHGPMEAPTEPPFEVSVDTEADARVAPSYRIAPTPIRSWLVPIVLVVFFLLCGCSRIAQEAFKHISVAGERPTFLLTAFVVAGIPSVIFLAYQFFVVGKAIMPTEWAFGIAMGLTNILQSHFILKCLEYYSGFIVFPVTSAGSVLFTTVVATTMLGERLTLKSCIGIAIAVAALFLLH